MEMLTAFVTFTRSNGVKTTLPVCAETDHVLCAVDKVRQCIQHVLQSQVGNEYVAGSWDAAELARDDCYTPGEAAGIALLRFD